VVLFYSLEMSSVQLSDRLISIVGHIDGWKIRTGKLASTDWVMLSQAAGTLTSKRLFIDDRPDVSIHGIRAGARRVLAREGHLDLVVVDYLQLMQSHSSARQQDRHLEVGAISRGLKKLAKELNTTVVAVAQLNRKIEDRGDTANPRLADIRESGSIEADADIVIMLTGGKNKDTTAHVLKQRHGPTGVIDLMFDASQGKFGCVDYVHKQEAQEGDPTWRP